MAGVPNGGEKGGEGDNWRRFGLFGSLLLWTSRENEVRGEEKEDEKNNTLTPLTDSVGSFFGNMGDLWWKKERVRDPLWNHLES